VAIGRQAILTGYSVLFVPAPTLVAQLAKAHSEGKLEDRLLHFGKPKLLIIDSVLSGLTASQPDGTGRDRWAAPPEYGPTKCYTATPVAVSSLRNAIEGASGTLD
jgi:hypothetical protein